jgi:hypothetical protein
MTLLNVAFLTACDLMLHHDSTRTYLCGGGRAHRRQIDARVLAHQCGRCGRLENVTRLRNESRSVNNQMSEREKKIR